MIKKNDMVAIRQGKDRGRRGKVLRVYPKKGLVLVEGMNLFKKHRRSRKAEGRGEVVIKSMPVPLSRTGLWCATCGKAVRIRMKSAGNLKVRACAKCGKEF